MPFPRRRKKTATPKQPAAPKSKPVKKDFIFHTITLEELLPDGSILCQFTIPGRAATKKTHQDIIYVAGSPRIVPSRQYISYEKVAKAFCAAAWTDKGHAPMDYGVAVSVRIYLNNFVVGDCTGYYQAIGDILQKWGVISNDSWLHWRDGGQHWLGGVDKENPRVEITITRMRHPKETYRADKEIAEQKRLTKLESKTKIC